MCWSCGDRLKGRSVADPHRASGSLSSTNVGGRLGGTVEVRPLGPVDVIVELARVASLLVRTMRVVGIGVLGALSAGIVVGAVSRLLMRLVQVSAGYAGSFKFINSVAIMLIYGSRRFPERC